MLGLQGQGIAAWTCLLLLQQKAFLFFFFPEEARKEINRGGVFSIDNTPVRVLDVQFRHYC